MWSINSTEWVQESFENKKGACGKAVEEGRRSEIEWRKRRGNFSKAAWETFEKTATEGEGNHRCWLWLISLASLVNYSRENACLSRFSNVWFGAHTYMGSQLIKAGILSRKSWRTLWAVGVNTPIKKAIKFASHNLISLVPLETYLWDGYRKQSGLRNSSQWKTIGNILNWKTISVLQNRSLKKGVSDRFFKHHSWP